MQARVDTVRIVIKGEKQPAPVVINDLKVVAVFHIGAGPGKFKEICRANCWRPQFSTI
jgi:hypothetical protein